MKKYFLFFIFLFLSFTSCSHKVEYPTWFKNPPEDKKNLLYATGEGMDKISAINDALTQIANRISTSISSEMFVYKGYTQNDSNVNTIKSVQKQVLQKINNFHFYDYKVLKIKNIADRDYVALVVVDKNKNKKLIVEKNKDKIYLLINQFNNLKNPIEKIKFAKNSIEVIDKKILPELFIAKVLGANVDYLIKKAERFLITLQNYLQNIKITIKANKYKNILADSVNFPIVSNSDLVIEMKVIEHFQRVVDEFIVQVKAIITIRYKNSVLLTKEIIIAKSSYVNYKIAVNLALEELRNKLKQFFNTIL